MRRYFLMAAVVMVVVMAASAAAAASPSPEHYRVLILGPVGSRSLYHLCSSLGEALGDAGHDVTLLSSFKPKSSYKHARVRQLHTGANNSLMEESNLFELQDNDPAMFALMMDAMMTIGNQMWNNEEIKQLWRERNTFHAIVIIGYVNEVATPFLLDYQGVFIDISTAGIVPNIIGNQGNWLPFSVVPNIMSDYTMHMTFMERTLNALARLYRRLLRNFFFVRNSQNILEKYFPGMPPILELYANSSLTLINSHFSIDGMVPLLPTQVEIGTINAKKPGPLPKDLEEFVEGAGEAGVILFSLGSIARSTHVPRKYKDVLVEAFGRLPQRVIWKYEGDDLQLPPNVMAKAWVPQQDLLGHNRTRLFISHCGNLGLQEAQYHGVPILGMPLAFDQPRNAHRMAKNDYGLVLHWNELTVEALLETVHTILHTPRFQEKLVSVSRALQDQKESPRERATWWVEYAIRHKGAPHMTYAGRRLHYLQYIMADIFAFWFTVLAASLLLSISCLRRVMRCCRKSHKHSVKMHHKYD